MALDDGADPADTGPAALDDGRDIAPSRRGNQLRLQMGRHGDALSQAKALAENLALLGQGSEARAELGLLAFDAANLHELLKRRGALA